VSKKSNHRVLIGKPLQLEKIDAAGSKMDAAKSKNTSAKALFFPASHYSDAACTYKREAGNADIL
jgi:hypothetical protein